MKVTLVQCTPNPIQTLANIASICYDSVPSKEIVQHLYRNGHHSVFEHVYFTWLIEDISRACSHQLVRHRHCAFTQRSQRYCKEDGFEYVCPLSVETSSSAQFDDLMLDINLYYDRFMSEGVSTEDARMILPNACCTKLYMSCNLRELIHIANERLCNRAQWEIRHLVSKMVKLVPDELKFMLVPKCKSGRIVCNQPCREK